ncbi:MAG: ATPase, T2SS/T4P/T4SS family [bacterium]
MANGPIRQRGSADQDDSDEWLIAAARRAGHPLPQRARSRGTTAWRELLNAGLSDAEVLRIACGASGAQPADLTQLSPELGQLLPQRVALEHKVAPIGVDKGTLVVATSNPKSAELERDLAFAAKQRVRLAAANPSDILRAQSIVYAAVYGTRADPGALFPPRTSTPIAQPTLAPPDRPMLTTNATPSTAQKTAVTPAPPPNIVDKLLGAAIAEKASEVILEPAPDGGFLVRLRIDGTRHDRFRLAAPHRVAVIDTLRSRAKLDPGASGHGRRGAITFDSPDGAVVARVSIEPASNGQECVILRLRWTKSPPKLSELGLDVTEQHRIKQLLGARRGLLVVTGPAGAGKTTMLYAAARELVEGNRAVTTIEEPIEQPLERVTQIQLSESHHLTLDSALRAVLRTEGDVIMIGEPLVAATVEQSTAVDAPARLIVATLNAADFHAALTQLRELHPDGASLAAVLQGIVVLRLVRRLCASCAQAQTVSELPEQQQRLLYGHPTAKVRRPVGCPACRTTGYAGRLAIAEVAPIDAALRTAITLGATPAETVQLCRDAGVPTLWDSGLQHVLDGTTSLAELLDTAPPPEAGGAAPQEDIDALLAQLLGTPKAQPATEVAIAAPTVATPAPMRAAAPAPAAPTLSAPSAAAALRVLLVDDDAAARRELARELARLGLVVLQAADGVAGLELAKRIGPDIIVSEVALPRMDVVAMLGALGGTNASVPVVVLTEQKDVKLTAWLRESGAKDVLGRELGIDALVARLRAIVGAARPRG